MCKHTGLFDMVLIIMTNPQRNSLSNKEVVYIYKKQKTKKLQG